MKFKWNPVARKLVKLVGNPGITNAVGGHIMDHECVSPDKNCRIMAVIILYLFPNHDAEAVLYSINPERVPRRRLLQNHATPNA